MKPFAILICAAVLFTLPRQGRAGTHTWTGGSTSGLWSVPSNWENSNPPFANESPLHLVFPTNATRRLSTNNIPNLTIDSITLAGSAYTIAATAAATNLVVDSSEGSLWWNMRVLSGTGHHLLATFRPALEGNFEFLVSTGASVEISAPLSAATPNSGLSKDGPGTLILSPLLANSYDGTTTIRDGTLRLEGGFFFGTFNPVVTVPGPLVIGNVSPIANAQCLVWEANQIADDAPVTVNQNGQLNLADVNETIGSLSLYGGYVDSANGMLKLNGNVSAGTSPNGHPGEIRGWLDLGILGRFFNVASNAWLDVGAIISGGTFGNAAAGVTKHGPGLMSLSSSSNTFGGYLHVSAGSLSFSRAAQLGAATNGTSVASNAMLVLTGVGNGPIVTAETLSLADGAQVKALLNSAWKGPVVLNSGKAIFDVPTNRVLEIGNVISGAGGFNKVNQGELLITGSTNNTFTGAACVEDGLLSLKKTGLFGNAIAISGPLIVGFDDDTKSPVVSLLGDEEIAPGVPVIVNENGELHLSDHEQTIGSLAVNGGTVNSGLSGLLKLAGDIHSTNYLPHFGDIHGHIDLGNEPRSIHVAGYSAWLRVFANISGGAAATLTKLGPNNLDIYGSNTYAGLTMVSDGALHIHHPRGLGATNGGTVVAYPASLFLTGFAPGQPGMTISGERLTLNASGDPETSGALASFGTNTWDGLVILQSTAGVRTESPTDRLTFSRRVEGPGGLIKIGQGKLILSGVGAFSYHNTYSGTTVVRNGELHLAKDSFFHNTALAGNLSIQPAAGASAIVRVQGREQFAGSNSVFIAAGGELRIESPTFNSIGSLSGEGILNFASGSRLVTGVNGQNSTFAGTLQGGGVNDTNLCMQGSGIFTLAGNNTLAGKVEVTGGTLRVNSAQPAARVDVKFQGTLGGTGSVNVVTMRGGYLAPGAPLGKLHASTYAVGASHAMHLQLNGPAVGTGYDQFEVDAAPDLSFTQLGATFGAGFNPTNGQPFLLVRNNSAQPVVQPFSGLAEGATFYVDASHRVKISYLGGDGNDVVLSVVPMEGQFKGISTDGARATILGCGTPGALYEIQASTNLGDPNGWSKLGMVMAEPDGMMSYVDAEMRAFPQRYFRFVTP